MDVFSLAAKITLDTDEYDKGLSSASKKTTSFADAVSRGFGNVSKGFSAISKVFTSVSNIGQKAGQAIVSSFKTLGVVSTAAAGGIAAIGKSAFGAYADYEQLVGGIETLFKNSADTVMNYANNAYKTAGLSANEYMELTTSFSASLLQSLGGDTAAAAKMSNKAIVDMSDNINKMGSTAQSVQDAYRGFAKQNFTMLDNLKLGYGGTKEEMERLLSDAMAVKAAHGELADYSIDSFADIVEAIHVVQTEMGITGTTALEASTTIQGSVAAMKSAWKNFTVGIADSNQDMEKLMDNLVESVVTVGKNVVPRAQEIVKQMIRVGPEVVRGFMGIGREFVGMAGQIVQALATGLQQYMPEILESGKNLIGWLADGIIQNGAEIGRGATGIITGLIDIIGSNSGKLVQAGIVIVDAIASGFKDIMGAVTPYISDFVPLLIHTFLSFSESFFSVGMEILGAVGRGLTENQSRISAMASTTIQNIVSSLVKNAPDVFTGAIALIEALVDTLVENAPMIAVGAVQIVSQLATSIGDAFPKLIPKAVEGILEFAEALTSPESINGLLDAAVDIINGLLDGIMAAMPLVVENAPQIISNIVAGLINAIPRLLEIGGKLVEFIIQGFIYQVQMIPQVLQGIWDGIVEGLKDVFGEEEVNSVFEGFANVWESISNAATSAWGAIQSAWGAVVDFFSGIWEGIKEAFTPVAEVLGGFFSSAWDIIKAVWDAAVGFFSGVWEGIKAVFSAVAIILGAFFSAAWDIIKGVWNKAVGFFSGVWDGIKEVFSPVAEVLGNFFSSAWDAIKGVWNVVVGFFTGVWNGIKGVFSSVATWFGDTFRSAWNNITNAFANVGQFFSSIWNTISGTFTGLVSSASQWGSDLIDNFVGGITAFAHKVADAVSGVANTVKSFLGFSEPEKGPLSNFHTYAPDMMKLFAQGITDNANLLKTAFNNSLNFAQTFPAAAIDYSVPVGQYSPISGANSSGYSESGVVINQTIYAAEQSPIELAANTRAAFQRARWAVG